MAVLRMADDEVVRDAVGAESLSVPLKGVFARAEPFPLTPAFKKGEAVLLMTGGVCVLDGGLLSFFIDGLSHEEKKSSPGSPDGVDAPSRKVGERISVTAISSGNLCGVNLCHYLVLSSTHSLASAAARLFSSSLYLVAVVEV